MTKSNDWTKTVIRFLYLRHKLTFQQPPFRIAVAWAPDLSESGESKGCCRNSCPKVETLADLVSGIEKSPLHIYTYVHTSAPRRYATKQKKKMHWLCWKGWHVAVWISRVISINNTRQKPNIQFQILQYPLRDARTLQVCNVEAVKQHPKPTVFYAMKVHREPWVPDVVGHVGRKHVACPGLWWRHDVIATRSHKTAILFERRISWCIYQSP